MHSSEFSPSLSLLLFFLPFPSPLPILALFVVVVGVFGIFVNFLIWFSTPVSSAYTFTLFVVCGLCLCVSACVYVCVYVCACWCVFVRCVGCLQHNRIATWPVWGRELSMRITIINCWNLFNTGKYFCCADKLDLRPEQDSNGPAIRTQWRISLTSHTLTTLGRARQPFEGDLKATA